MSASFVFGHLQGFLLDVIVEVSAGSTDGTGHNFGSIVPDLHGFPLHLIFPVLGCAEEIFFEERFSFGRKDIGLGQPVEEGLIRLGA